MDPRLPQGLDANPLPSGDPAEPELTEAWATLGLAAALYDQGSWGILTDALREARSGNGASLMGLANTYADRVPGGGYSGNIMEVIYAVNCLDRPDSPDLATYAGYAKRLPEGRPDVGPYLAWGSAAVGVWPVKGDNGPHKISAEGSNPIVVVGTTRDPATIYEWSKQLRDQLANGVLISLDGDGHTAYAASSQCVDDAIDAYYVRGTRAQGRPDVLSDEPRRPDDLPEAPRGRMPLCPLRSGRSLPAGPGRVTGTDRVPDRAGAGGVGLVVAARGRRRAARRRGGSSAWRVTRAR